jgi:cell division protein FtsZ
MVAFDRTQSQDASAAPLKICIAGVGGAGSNVLERIILERTLEASLVGIQTDVRVLSHSCAPEKIQLGADLMRGIGAGGDPELGREAAMFSRDKIRDSIDGHDMVFITVGLGGGTGSGAAPIVAEIAKSTGAMVLVFAAVPFSFEGRRRHQQSREALDRLEKSADALILFENDRMGELVLAKDGIQKAFLMADQTISCSIRAVANMVSAPGLVKLGLGDLMAALRSTDSRCLFGHGEASGKERGTEALKRALKSPLISEGLLLQNASSLLVHVVGGESLTLTEVEGVMRQLGRRVPEQTQIHFGLGVNPKMGERISVTLISSTSANALANYREAAANAVTAAIPLPKMSLTVDTHEAKLAPPVETLPKAATPPEPTPVPVVVAEPVIESTATVEVAVPPLPAAKPVAPAAEAAPKSKTAAIPVLAKPAPVAKAKQLAPPPEEDLFTSLTPSNRVTLPSLPVAVAAAPEDLFAHLADSPLATSKEALEKSPKTAPLPKKAEPEPELELLVDPEPEEAEFLAPEDTEPEPLFADAPEPEQEEDEEEILAEEELEPVTAAAVEPVVETPPTKIASILTQVISATNSPSAEVVDEVTFEEEEEIEAPVAEVLAERQPEPAPIPSAAPALGRTRSEPLLKTITRMAEPIIQREEAPAPEPQRSIVSSPVAPNPVKTKSVAAEQPVLAIASDERSNHFKDSDQTIVQGEDLDTPTWMRLRRKVTR